MYFFTLCLSNIDSYSLLQRKLIWPGWYHVTANGFLKVLYVLEGPASQYQNICIIDEIKWVLSKEKSALVLWSFPLQLISIMSRLFSPSNIEHLSCWQTKKHAITWFLFLLRKMGHFTAFRFLFFLSLFFISIGGLFKKVVNGFLLLLLIITKRSYIRHLSCKLQIMYS